jgi:hypothetical protein
MPSRRTPLVLVTGLDRGLATQVSNPLLERPGTVVVHHDVRDLGQGVLTQRGLLP